MTEPHPYSNADQLVEWGRELRYWRLTWGTAGNLSLRSDDSRCLITASGSWLDRLTPDQISLCGIDTGDHLDGPRPSVEYRMHTGIYRVRPEARCIAHLSPHYTTLCACTNMPITQQTTVENMLYIGSITHVPYIHPGTQELADAVTEAARDHDTIILDNHGVIAWHRSVAALVMRLLTLEEACRLQCDACSAGLHLRPLDPSVVRELRESVGYH